MKEGNNKEENEEVKESKVRERRKRRGERDWEGKRPRKSRLF